MLVELKKDKAMAEHFKTLLATYNLNSLHVFATMLANSSTLGQSDGAHDATNARLKSNVIETTMLIHRLVRISDVLLFAQELCCYYCCQYCGELPKRREFSSSH